MHFLFGYVYILKLLYLITFGICHIKWQFKSIYVLFMLVYKSQTGPQEYVVTGCLRISSAKIQFNKLILSFEMLTMLAYYN